MPKFIVVFPFPEKPHTSGLMLFVRVIVVLLKSTVIPLFVIVIGSPLEGPPIRVLTAVGWILQPTAFPFKVIEALITTLVTFPVLPTILEVPPPQVVLHVLFASAGCEWLRMGSMLNNMSNKNL